MKKKLLAFGMAVLMLTGCGSHDPVRSSRTWWNLPYVQ